MEPAQGFRSQGRLGETAQTTAGIGHLILSNRPSATDLRTARVPSPHRPPRACPHQFSYWPLTEADAVRDVKPPPPEQACNLCRKPLFSLSLVPSVPWSLLLADNYPLSRHNRTSRRPEKHSTSGWVQSGWAGRAVVAVGLKSCRLSPRRALPEGRPRFV